MVYKPGQFAALRCLRILKGRDITENDPDFRNFASTFCESTTGLPGRAAFYDTFNKLYPSLGAPGQLSESVGSIRKGRFSSRGPYMSKYTEKLSGEQKILEDKRLITELILRYLKIIKQYLREEDLVFWTETGKKTPLQDEPLGDLITIVYPETDGDGACYVEEQIKRELDNAPIGRGREKLATCVGILQYTHSSAAPLDLRQVSDSVGFWLDRALADPRPGRIYANTFVSSKRIAPARR